MSYGPEHPKPWTAPRPGQTGLAKAGYVLALLLPIVGFFIAIVLLARNEVGPGLATLLLCAVGAVAGAALLML